VLAVEIYLQLKFFKMITHRKKNSVMPTFKTRLQWLSVLYFRICRLGCGLTWNIVTMFARQSTVHTNCTE